MKRIFFTAACIIFSFCTACTQPSSSQQLKPNAPRVGGSCEGCEAIFETPVSFLKLSWIDTLPDFIEEGPKLELTGTVFGKNGQPAPGIIIYAYHTNQAGLYPTKGSEAGWGKRHGYIRGWVKTNGKGEYKFLTNRPGAYPGRNAPEHIHMIVKEPDKNEYYIDDVVFDDDPLLTAAHRRTGAQGGSGILVLERRNGVLQGKRDIYLGKNVEGYGK